MNIQSIFVLVIVLGLLAWVVRGLVRRERRAKGGCCNCKSGSCIFRNENFNKKKMHKK